MSAEFEPSDEAVSAYSAAVHESGGGVYMSGGMWRVEANEHQIRAGLAAALAVETSRLRAQWEREAHQARRGDDVEAWIKRERDGYPEDGGSMSIARAAIDDLLDAYRLHADTGTPLGAPTYEGDPTGEASLPPCGHRAALRIMGMPHGHVQCVLEAHGDDVEHRYEQATEDNDA